MQRLHVAIRRLYFDAEFRLSEAIKFLTMRRRICASCHVRTWRFESRDEDDLYCERCMPF